MDHLGLAIGDVQIFDFEKSVVLIRLPDTPG